jgi:hypothetical protein
LENFQVPIEPLCYVDLEFQVPNEAPNEMTFLNLVSHSILFGIWICARKFECQMRWQIFQYRSMRSGIWICARSSNPKWGAKWGDKYLNLVACGLGSGYVNGEQRLRFSERAGRERRERRGASERATTRAGDPKRGGHGAAFRVSVAASVQGAGAY